MSHRGFLGSFSTSALLVAAAVSILLTVSAIVAFKGWPGPTGETPTETFLLETSAPASDIRPTPELVLRPAGERAGGSGSGSGAPADGGAGSGGGASSGADPVLPESSSSVPEGGAAPPAPADPSAPLSPASPTADGGGTPPGSTGGDVLGGTADRATGALEGGSDTLGPVADRVQGLVEGSTDSVNNLVGGR